MIDQSVVAHPVIRVNYGIKIGVTVIHLAQRGFRNIGHNLGVHLNVAFKQTRDDGPVRSYAATFPRTRRGPKKDSSASVRPLKGKPSNSHGKAHAKEVVIGFASRDTIAA